MYQTMPYEEQLHMKERQIRELLEEVLVKEGQTDLNGKADFVWEGIHGSPEEFCYRNKMEFSFGDEYKDGPLSLGLHKKGSTYDVLNTDDCKLVHKDMTDILTCVRDYFLEKGVPYYKKMTAYRISASSASEKRGNYRRNSDPSGNYKSGGA